MRVGLLNDLLSIKDKVLERLLRRIINVLDGNIDFQDNCRVRIVKDVKFTVIDQDVPVEHDLGLIARNFTVVGSDNYALFQWGTNPPEVNRLWLKCDHVPTVADIMIVAN
jgi:hypothetical protein